MTHVSMIVDHRDRNCAWPPKKVTTVSKRFQSVNGRPALPPFLLVVQHSCSKFAASRLKFPLLGVERSTVAVLGCCLSFLWKAFLSILLENWAFSFLHQPSPFLAVTSSLLLKLSFWAFAVQWKDCMCQLEEAHAGVVSGEMQAFSGTWTRRQHQQSAVLDPVRVRGGWRSSGRAKGPNGTAWPDWTRLEIPVAVLGTSQSSCFVEAGASERPNVHEVGEQCVWWADC